MEKAITSMEPIMSDSLRFDDLTPRERMVYLYAKLEPISLAFNGNTIDASVLGFLPKELLFEGVKAILKSGMTLAEVETYGIPEEYVTTDCESEAAIAELMHNEPKSFTIVPIDTVPAKVFDSGEISPQQAYWSSMTPAQRRKEMKKRMAKRTKTMAAKRK